MLMKNCKILTALLFAILYSVPSFSQSGANTSYSPYSIFAIGDLYPNGTTRDRAMGGVGVAGRDPRYINVTNPAAISARDTLSVMFDLGMVADNKLYQQNDLKSANNTVNLNNFAVSFPIYKSTAVLFGVSPYSSVGYDYSYNMSDPEILASTGFINYTAKGTGGIYQMYAGVGTSFFKRLAIGAEAVFHFGSINKQSYMGFSQGGYRAIKSGYDMKLKAMAGKFGIQYELPLGGTYMTVGATYKTAGKLRGFVEDYKLASLGGLVDTVYHRTDTLAQVGKVALSDEIAVGVSFRKPEKWAAEVNYTMSGWGASGFDSAPGFANEGALTFSTRNTKSVRAGFEYIPNRNDIRYYLRQCAYRCGVYYDQSYYKLDGNTIDSYGITLGVTLPVVRYYNGISLGVDVGRRGSRLENMTKETYASFVIGINIHDLWFIKPRYE